MLRHLTAGESHGKDLVAILDGCPANLPLSSEDINQDRQRRQTGVGRGERMKIEKDKVEILSGLRKGKTFGSPLALLIPNKSTELFEKVVTVHDEIFYSQTKGWYRKTNNAGGMHQQWPADCHSGRYEAVFYLR